MKKAFFVAVVLMFALVPFVDSQRILDDLGPLARQIAINTARLDSVERDIASLKTWQVTHGEIDTRERIEMGRLAQMVDKHENLIWIVVGVIVGVIFDWVARAMGYAHSKFWKVR